MTVLDLLLGRPLASDEARAECVGPAAGIPIFGLDALSSAAYGPEAALTLLIPLGAAGIAYMVPISAGIIVLLTIVYFSYRQTIQAYPGGGGSYTVARQNLGVSAGLLAAAALMIDYILVVAVGISAGVGALVSAVPSSGRAQSPSIGSICLRKCDCAVFRVLGFKVPATCSRHSRITALSVAVLLGTGGVAPFAAARRRATCPPSVHFV
jgi:amino acid transporter